MGIFSKILGGVFGKKKQEKQEQQEAEVKAASDSSGNPIESIVDAITPDASEAVDVDAVLSAKAAAKGEKLDWKVSIVDLLKLLDIDASYGARKELAAELGISGYEGTAEQNIQMQKVVLNKLAANGGIVPADLLD